jgi:preprotein translocase subunit SecD
MVQSFSATLALGVIVSLFTAIMVSRTLLRVIAVSFVSKYLVLFSPSGKS